jgi:hypothetical protein
MEKRMSTEKIHEKIRIAELITQREMLLERLRRIGVTSEDLELCLEEHESELEDAVFFKIGRIRGLAEL